MIKKYKEFIPLAKPDVSCDEIAAVTGVLRSGWWATGRENKELESEVLRYLSPAGGASLSGLPLNSCTAGLYLALKGFGIGDDTGDEVIVPTWTFAATAHAVLWAGAKPVLCDVKKEDLNIDIQALAGCITSRTKAIIPVHFAGNPCDMDELSTLARKKGVKVIEDAAHAFGSSFNGKRIGNHSDAVSFSFYATKNLACGEGGMLVSGDEGFIEKLRKLSYYGINRTAYNRYHKSGSWYYEVDEAGFKFNLDDIHAAIARVQLKKVDGMNVRRREIDSFYRRELQDVLSFLSFNPLGESSHHLCVALLPEGVERSGFIEKLKECHIGAGVHFIPLHKHPFFQAKLSLGCYPVADALYPRVFSLPLYPSLKEEELQFICTTIRELLLQENVK